MIAVLDYGIGNLCSAHKALVHLGGDARLVSEPGEARGAHGVVLPGVGAFGRCMEALRSTGLDRVALDAIDQGTPFFGICVGAQMLFSCSEESPGIPGLSVLDGEVRSISGDVKRPHMQWNVLHRTGSGSRMLAGVGESPWVYFVHSFAPVPTDTSGCVVATCEYGGEVVSAVESGPVWGTQFHPEKSGKTGMAILKNFVSLCDKGNRE